MVGFGNLLREALLSLAEHGGGRMRTISRTLGQDADAPSMVMNLVRRDGFGAPRNVTWDYVAPMSDPEASVQQAIHDIWDERAAQNISPDTENPTLTALLRKGEALRRMQETGHPKKFALSAFRAAKQALMDDIDARSPFEPWSPQSGYVFYGATPTHEKIYERMVAGAKHPDYFATQSYDPELDRRIFRLRRRFPLRHEVAAGAGLGVLGYAADTNEN